MAEGDVSEAVHVFHRKQKSAKQKEAGSEPKAAAAADIEVNFSTALQMLSHMFTTMNVDK